VRIDVSSDVVNTTSEKFSSDMYQSVPVWMKNSSKRFTRVFLGEGNIKRIADVGIIFVQKSVAWSEKSVKVCQRDWKIKLKELVPLEKVLDKKR